MRRIQNFFNHMDTSPSISLRAMQKTRNFFLGIFGFFLLSIILFFFSELVWSDSSGHAAVGTVPATEILSATATHQGDPGWLIPPEQIAFYCNHPWVIRRKLPVSSVDIDEFSAAGLSECYQFAGERAIESHLWHQGVRSSLDPQEQLVELYFRHDADFEHLGLQPPEMVRLSGVVAHDLNGDALVNPGEPRLPGAEICIDREPLSPLCTHTDPDGEYSFDQLLPGAWHFQISSPDTDRLTAFKYVNQLIEADYHIPETTIHGYTIEERMLNLTEFQTIENPILLLVDQDKTHDFLLMQEWATYFSAPKDADRFKTEAYFDLDVRKGVTRIFNGESGPTYDQHDGLDTSCPRGTEIVSVAEGRVIAILNESTVAVQHSNQLISVYGHGDPLVEENQFVPRGYPVALCNNHLTESSPHLHFAVWQSTPWLHLVSYGIPPFADLIITEEKWVANQYPLEKDYFVYLLLGGRGVWTEINQPHLPNVKMLQK
jgi:hypothetical protein